MTYIVTRNSEGLFESGQKNHFSKAQIKARVWEGSSNLAAYKKAEELNNRAQSDIETAGSKKQKE